MAERRCRARRFAEALLLSTLLLSACKQDADEELRKSVRSWRGSIELAQREQAKQNVSPKYVKQVAKLASKSLGKAIADPAVKPDTRRSAEEVVEAADKISGSGD